MSCDELDDQHFGEQSDVVVTVTRVTQRESRAIELAADADDRRAAGLRPLEDAVVPGRAGEGEQPVVGVLGEVDVDVRPVA